jgi:pantoate--beta-alanine ligase
MKELPRMPRKSRPKCVQEPKALLKILGQARAKGQSIGFVPTMGALHLGHLSLVERCQQENSLTVVSIFVNPAQFGPDEDFQRYPRTLPADLRLLASLRPPVVFNPEAASVYPKGEATRVGLQGPLVNVLEGASRPIHFMGVATVVAKLFGWLGPCKAYFGEKDWQQLQVVKRMTADLNLPVQVLGCPTLRESDGFAMSSRNAYLSPAQRATAPKLKQGLDLAAKSLLKGQSPAMAARTGMAFLDKAGFKTDYLAITDAETLQAPQLGRSRRILAAVRLGSTRLIDNIPA